MIPPPASVAAALQPVREAILSGARTEARRMLAEADRDAAEVLEQARREADRVDDDARARGAVEAQVRVQAERSRSRRAVQTAELRAEREIYDALRERIAERLRERCSGAGSEDLQERLAQRLRAHLGPGAVLSGDPGGGLVAKIPGRFADCSVRTLAESAVDALGAEVTALWRR